MQLHGNTHSVMTGKGFNISWLLAKVPIMMVVLVEWSSTGCWLGLQVWWQFGTAYWTGRLVLCTHPGRLYPIFKHNSNFQHPSVRVMQWLLAESLWCSGGNAVKSNCPCKIDANKWIRLHSIHRAYIESHCGHPQAPHSPGFSTFIRAVADHGTEVNS